MMICRKILPSGQNDRVVFDDPLGILLSGQNDSADLDDSVRQITNSPNSAQYGA